ncbi:MAG: Hsp20/alpha crystallin family protein [Sedimentisphaerales bacterium]|nr:Hsp20/alpha crystallin family protein [Sedimentisphaerales bacterium]
MRTELQKKESQDIEKQEAQAGDMERTRDRTVFIPRVDIHERKDALVVVADMPGVDEKSVDINVERHVLTITGRVESNPPVENRRLSYCEYRTGDYERSFTLSDEVDIDRIEGTVKQGVLELVLPKAEASRPKQISVKAG